MLDSLPGAANFVMGGRWDISTSRSAPTRSTSPTGSTCRQLVFSAEHYAPIVHNWVCWAAPLHDPVSGAKLGVLDISTTWIPGCPDPGLRTAGFLARLVEQAMPRTHQYADRDH